MIHHVYVLTGSLTSASQTPVASECVFLVRSCSCTPNCCAFASRAPGKVSIHFCLSGTQNPDCRVPSARSALSHHKPSVGAQSQMFTEPTGWRSSGPRSHSGRWGHRCSVPALGCHGRTWGQCCKGFLTSKKARNLFFLCV